jgi:N6-adenosine-specific RNA methylase IME4
MKFNVIVCDCPWSPADGLNMNATKRGAASNYTTMSTDDLCALPIKDLTDTDGCVLALWVIGSMLEDGMRVMKSWGFQQKQTFVWCKTKKPKSLTKILKSTLDIALQNNIDDTIKLAKDSVISLGDYVLGFGLGRLFRQTHELCLIGVNNTKIYKHLQDRAQRSVCFDENKGHSIKTENLQDRLDIMFPGGKKVELFARRQRRGWTCVGDGVSNEDIRISLEKIINA